MMQIKKLKMSKFLAMTTLFIMVTLGDALAKCVSENRHVTDNVGKTTFRKYGVHDANIEDSPWQVAISVMLERASERRFLCGGSIISRNWIVSAGRCLSGKASRLVHAGSADLFNEKSSHNIFWIIWYPYTSTDDRLFKDIALAKVREPFVFDDTRRPVPLSRKNIESLEGSLATVSGWVVTDDHMIHDMLQSVEVPILGMDKCRQSINISYISHSGFFCAGYDEGGKDSWSGNWGGPLTVNGTLVGIVSWGRGPNEPKLAGVYTDIAYFYDWIKDQPTVELCA